jgi:hypothetical protein
MSDSPKSLEARAWLSSNANRSAFATNKCGDTAGALAFVEALYAAGATEVVSQAGGDMRARD